MMEHRFTQQALYSLSQPSVTPVGRGPRETHKPALFNTLNTGPTQKHHHWGIGGSLKKSASAFDSHEGDFPDVMLGLFL